MAAPTWFNEANYQEPIRFQTTLESTNRFASAPYGWSVPTESRSVSFHWMKRGNEPEKPNSTL